MYMSGELHTRVTVRSVSRDLLVKATVVISSRNFTLFMEPQCLEQPPTGLYLSQLIVVYIFTSYLINTLFNIILPYSLCLRSCIFRPGFPSEKYAYTFHFSDACYTPRLSSSLICLPQLCSNGQYKSFPQLIKFPNLLFLPLLQVKSNLFFDSQINFFGCDGNIKVVCLLLRSISAPCSRYPQANVTLRVGPLNTLGGLRGGIIKLIGTITYS